MSDSRKEARRQRLRHPQALPLLPEHNSFPFARRREDLRWQSPAQLVGIIQQTPEWEQTVGLACDEAWAKLAPMSRERMAYSFREVAAVELLRIVLGHEKLDQVRDYLGGDRGSGARKVMGFVDGRDHIKDRYRPIQEYHDDERRYDGVPSVATLDRYIKKLGRERLADAYEHAFELIVPAHLREFPQMRSEARIQFIDGSGIRTHYTAPHYRKGHDGKPVLINRHRVTAWEAGATRSNKPEKTGDGWNLVSDHCVSGLALIYAVTKWHEAENKTAEQLVLEKYRDLVLPHLDLAAGELCVISGDRAFHRHELRRRLKELRLVENIHLASHGKDDGELGVDDAELKYAAKLDAFKTPIDGTGWYVNGHLEPVCHCGHGRVARRFAEASGRAVAWTEGACPNCGPLSLTPGRWRKVQNPTKWVESQPGETGDWALGNGLTFHGKLSEYYGSARSAYQEGAHGVLENGYGLLKHKRWFRTLAHVRYETAMVYFTQHALARWQRRMSAARSVAGPAPMDPRWVA